MTDFSEGKTTKCHICGERFFEPEGKLCDCWRCAECGEEFSDHDMLANSELGLCMYCEDLRYQEEGQCGSVAKANYPHQESKIK